MSSVALVRDVVAFIGARGGSKGLGGKNIRPLAGKPLLAWSVERAKRSKYVSRVIVSTDSEEYAAVARQYGAETPFLRPKELATDSSLEFEYIKHAVEWLEKNEGQRPRIGARLLNTIPLQMTEDLDGAI